MSELPTPELDRFIRTGEDYRFTVVATMVVKGVETMIGEARYAFDADALSVEFGLSIGDRWQNQGIGKALIGNLECRAASLEAGYIFGDTLRSNKPMISLARKSGYAAVARGELSRHCLPLAMRPCGAHEHHVVG
jgi:RimJ/RimL family protein N-acetyltransferase